MQTNKLEKLKHQIEKKRNINEYKSFPIKAKELERYNKLYPKAAKIILQDFERTSISKVEYNKKSLEAQINIDKLSQWQGFFVSIITIFSAVICGIFNQQVVASTLVGVSAIGLVKAILPIKHKEKKEVNNTNN